jgi:hypothetical protein
MSLTFKQFANLSIIDEVFLTPDGMSMEMLKEGKWVRGRFESNIRIDPPTHGAGQTHAHVLGRKGSEVGVVNMDGSGSHGTKCRLSDEDADALRARGFNIAASNIVEWTLCANTMPRLLLG